MNKIIKTFNSKRLFFTVSVVLFIILIAYGQTLGMYFWRDDSALMFKLQNPQGPAGSYGEGIIGTGPYKYLITLFVPFFPIFRLNPFGYFLIGLIAYCLSTVTFYLFASELLKNRKATLFSVLIYAAGYIGSDTMLQLGNSWQTNLGLILAFLLLWAYLKFFRSNQQYKYYFLALFLFYGCVEFVFIRSHSLIIPIIAIELFFTATSFKILKIPMIVIRQFPFWFIFYNNYLIDRSEGGMGLSVLLKNLLAGKVEILSGFLATVGNLVVPAVLQAKLATFAYPRTQLVLLVLVLFFNLFLHFTVESGKKLKILSACFLFITFFLNQFLISKDLFWYRSQLDFIAGGLGLYTVVIVLGLSVALWKNKKNMALTLTLGLVILMSQTFGYFIKYPEAIFTTTHRYLSYAFVGYSLIVGSVCFLLFEIISFHSKEAQKKFSYILAFIPLGLVLVTNLYLGVTYQSKFVKEVSRPTRNFYITLKQFVSTVKKGDVFYFDIEDNNFYRTQFGNFFSVGSMPDSTALAIYYNVDRYDVSLIDNFNELLNKLSKREIVIDDIHSFYFGKSGLVDTSTSLRKMLSSGSLPQTLTVKEENNPIFTLSNSDFSPISPSLLTIEASITPDWGNITFNNPNNNLKTNLFTLEQKMRMAGYLRSRQDYYKDVKPSSLSQWKFQEVAYVTDNNINTSWRAHRIHWHEKRMEELVVDLGFLQEISSVIWTNWRHIQTPSVYTIDISSDGKTWKKVLEVNNGLEKKDGESTRDDFNEEMAQFVRMRITGTISGEEPALSEFEVVKSLYWDIKVKEALALVDNPLNYISTKEELKQVLPVIVPLFNLKAAWETDRGKGEKEVPIGVLGSYSTYEFVLEAGGTTLNKITLSAPNIPVKINIKSGKLQNLSFSNIESRNLIKNVTKN